MVEHFHSMPQFIGNIDVMCDQHQNFPFFTVVQTLLSFVDHNGAQIFDLVTPEDSPQNSSGRGGVVNDGEANGDGRVAAA